MSAGSSRSVRTRTAPLVKLAPSVVLAVGVARVLAVERRRVGAAAVDQEPVVDGVERVDGVGQGGEEHRRLRLAHGDDLLRHEAAQHLVGPLGDRPADLAEDVERVGVARVFEGAVAGRVDVLQAAVSVLTPASAAACASTSTSRSVSPPPSTPWAWALTPM